MSHSSVAPPKHPLHRRVLARGLSCPGHRHCLQILVLAQLRAGEGAAASSGRRPGVLLHPDSAPEAPAQSGPKCQRPRPSLPRTIHAVRVVSRHWLPTGVPTGPALSVREKVHKPGTYGMKSPLESFVEGSHVLLS